MERKTECSSSSKAVREAGPGRLSEAGHEFCRQWVKNPKKDINVVSGAN